MYNIHAGAEGAFRTSAEFIAKKMKDLEKLHESIPIDDPAELARINGQISMLQVDLTYARSVSEIILRVAQIAGQ